MSLGFPLDSSLTHIPLPELHHCTEQYSVGYNLILTSLSYYYNAAVVLHWLSIGHWLYCRLSQHLILVLPYLSTRLLTLMITLIILMSY